MKRGFTLVELLTIIVLLAIVSVVIVTNMVGLQGSQTEKEYKNYVETLENAGCTYFEKSEYMDAKASCKSAPGSASCKISVNTLISGGLIAEDLYNPKEGKDVVEFTSDYVEISFDDGKKVCKLVEVRG